MVYYLLIVALVWAKYKVFVVFHSHNDAGWLMPAEDYYQDSTQHILNNLIDFLEIEPSFKFVWAETYFLSRYLEDYPHRKDQVKNFIKSGKLEIVGGGWVQNDEALADVEFVLRQMEIGFNYLRDELGVNKIKTGWQLDPFGHSSLTAALWEKMGFESLVFSRVERKFKVIEN
jgi:alpha-mannosidase